MSCVFASHTLKVRPKSFEIVQDYVDACTDTKPYRIGLLFTHKNADFGAKLRRADLESGSLRIG